MTSMTSPTTRVVIGGVDTHGQTHHAAVIDEVGRQLGDREFTASPAGYRARADWLGEYGTLTTIGVEGTGSYGAALARYLRTVGLTRGGGRPTRPQVAPRARQVRPPRRLRRRQGSPVGVGGGSAETAGWPRRGDPGAPRGPLQRGQSP
jgi:hypothetical protein